MKVLPYSWGPNSSVDFTPNFVRRLGWSPLTIVVIESRGIAPSKKNALNLGSGNYSKSAQILTSLSGSNLYVATKKHDQKIGPQNLSSLEEEFRYFKQI